MNLCLAGSFALLCALTGVALGIWFSRLRSPYWMIAIAMIGFGISAASSWSILSTLVADIVGIGAVATATAIIFFLTTVADAGGPVLFSNVIKITHSYQNGLIIYMLVALVPTITFGWMALRRKYSSQS